MGLTLWPLQWQFQRHMVRIKRPPQGRPPQKFPRATPLPNFPRDAYDTVDVAERGGDDGDSADAQRRVRFAGVHPQQESEYNIQLRRYWQEYDDVRRRYLGELLRRKSDERAAADAERARLALREERRRAAKLRKMHEVRLRREEKLAREAEAKQQRRVQRTATGEAERRLVLAAKMDVAHRIMRSSENWIRADNLDAKVQEVTDLIFGPVFSVALPESSRTLRDAERPSTGTFGSGGRERGGEARAERRDGEEPSLEAQKTTLSALKVLGDELRQRRSADGSSFSRAPPPPGARRATRATPSKLPTPATARELRDAPRPNQGDSSA